MGEGWGEGEIRNDHLPLILSLSKPLMVSLSNHVAIPLPATPLKILSILFIDVESAPLSHWERGRR